MLEVDVGVGGFGGEHPRRLVPAADIDAAEEDGDEV